MGISNLFSKRQKQLRGEQSDVFTYDNIPSPLRVQIVHIVRATIGKDGEGKAQKLYSHVNDVLCREYGLFELTKSHYGDTVETLIFNFFLTEKDTEKVLDVIEIFFQLINNYVKKEHYQYHVTTQQLPDEAIFELNKRFNEHGVGYQFESSEIIRVDSKFLHTEAIKPTLLILSSPHFQGANEEFLKAHEHYRHARYKECIVESLKSFESTMKAICKKNKWPFNQHDTSKALIATCFNKDIIPSFLQSQFNSLQSLLECGIPTVRNKLGGHGQGADVQEVPQYMAQYAMNLTASSILLLAEADKQKN